MSEARMHAERCHLAAMRRDAAAVIQGPQASEQIASAGEHGGGRWVEPAQLRGVSYSPVREIERERREVRIGDFGLRERRKTALRALAPRAIADTGFHATRAALPLICRRARDALRLEATHARRRVERRPANEARVHHDAHTGNRETRLRNVRGEHDLARTTRCRSQRGILLARGKVAEKRQNGYGGASVTRTA
jgi:hypothetical protein